MLRSFRILPRPILLIRGGMVLVPIAMAAFSFAPAPFRLPSGVRLLVIPGLFMLLIGLAYLEKHLHAVAKVQGFMVCPSCGYSLWNIEGPRCPECGAAFTHESLREAWNFRK